MGFEKPTPVQKEVIPEILSATADIVGLAQTGTGKTAAFGLPLLELIKNGNRETLVLVLCPTRELCNQITGDLVNYAKYITGIRITAVYGGAGIEPQIRSLKQGSQIIVATPGRLLDLIRRRACNIGNIKYLVLDEADIMLNMGFKEELDAILEAAPDNRRTVLLSATMSDEIRAIAEQYMRNPKEIVLGRKNTGIETVEHTFICISKKDKYNALKRLVDFYPDIYGIVFCRTKIQTQEIADKMIRDGYDAEALHGDLSQSQREFVMRKFRERRLQLLIATDIAARGLDVDDLTHIIHYDLPDQPAVYTHRSGRTGRAGKTGASISIITPNETHKIRRIKGIIKRDIQKVPIPTGRAICEKQLIHRLTAIRHAPVQEEQIAPYMPIVEEMLADIDPRTLIKNIVSLEFNRFLDYYKESKEIKNADNQGKGKHPKKNNSYHFTYMSVNLGKKHRVLPPELIGLVNQSTKIRNIKIGNIDIGAQSSRIEIENRFAGDVHSALNNFSYQGRKIKTELLGPSKTTNKIGKKKKNKKKS